MYVSTVSLFVRIILWALLVIAPGGVLLLPFLVGDAVARRKREEAPDGSRSSSNSSSSSDAAKPTVDNRLGGAASVH